MAQRKQLIIGTAAVAAVGLVSFLTYKVIKELGSIIDDDIIWENLDDEFHYRYPKNR